MSVPALHQFLLENLTSVGIQHEEINSTQLTLNSPRLICIRNLPPTQPGKPQTISILNVQVPKDDPRRMYKRPIVADSAIMSPSETQTHIALRAQTIIQVFDLDSKVKIQGNQLASSFKYWKWLSPSKLGLIGEDNGFYLWEPKPGGGEPVKLFDLDTSKGLGTTTPIVDIVESNDELSVAVVGRDEKSSTIQLYSIEKKSSQVIPNGFGIAYLRDGNVLALGIRDQSGVKLVVSTTTPTFEFKRIVMLVPDTLSTSVNPIAFLHGSNQNQLYIVLNTGKVLLFDTEERKFTGEVSVLESGDELFTATAHNAVNGIVAVSKSGKVVMVSNCENAFEEFQKLAPPPPAKVETPPQPTTPQPQQVVEEALGLLRVGNNNEFFEKFCKPGNPVAWPIILQTLLNENSPHVVALASSAVEKNLVPKKIIADFFIANAAPRVSGALLFEITKKNQPEDAEYQTKLISLTVKDAPEIASSMVKSGELTLFDVAAVEDIAAEFKVYDILWHLRTEYNARVKLLEHASDIDKAAIAAWLGTLTPNQILEVLELLSANILLPLPGPDGFVLQDPRTITYNMLAPSIDNVKNPDIVLKYIKVCCDLNKHAELIRVLSSNLKYDVNVARLILTSSTTQNKMPLVLLCERHGMIDELIEYFHGVKNGKNFIKTYIQHFHPEHAGKVLLYLLEKDVALVEEILEEAAESSCLDHFSDATKELEAQGRLGQFKALLEAKISKGGELESEFQNLLLKISM